MTTHIAPAFNLLDERWIPMRSHDGTVEEVSLTDALIGAGRFASIAETSPPNLVALHRLFLAVVHRALSTKHGPWREADRVRWFRDGLPGHPLRDYLETWRDRFWLLHSTHPFMQAAVLADHEDTRDRLKSWTLLALDRAKGDSPTLFDHTCEATPYSASLAVVARHLLGFLQFVPGGLVKAIRDSDNAGPLANTAAVTPTGASVSATIVMGLHPFDTRRVVVDLPAWESPPPTLAELMASPSRSAGPNDRYTRLSRAVQLVPSSNGHAPRVRLGAGVALVDDPMAPDPMASYQVDPKGRSTRITFSEGRALWRELPSLLPDAGKTTSVPAAILDRAAGLMGAMGDWGAHVNVVVAGIASYQAKLLRWRVDQIELPTVFLTDPGRASELRSQLHRAETTFDGLRSVLVDMVTAAMPNPQHPETKKRARSMLANMPTAVAFFGRAERVLPRLMQELASGDYESAGRTWSATLAEAIRMARDATHCAMGESSLALRAQARARPKIDSMLRSLLPGEPAQQSSVETMK